MLGPARSWREQARWSADSGQVPWTKPFVAGDAEGPRRVGKARHPATLMLGGLLRSGKLRTGLVFGLAALAFAAANLLLAHGMAPEAYGMVSLVVALMAVGGPLAPLGLAPIVVREHLPATPRLLGQCAATSALVAAATAAVAAAVYRLAGGRARRAGGRGGRGRLHPAGGGAVLQSEERFVASTLASESMNYLLLLAAVGVFALAPVGQPGRSASSPPPSWRSPAASGSGFWRRKDAATPPPRSARHRGWPRCCC